jgi:hypothetical protein
MSESTLSSNVTYRSIYTKIVLPIMKYMPSDNNESIRDPLDHAIFIALIWAWTEVCLGLVSWQLCTLITFGPNVNNRPAT